MQKHRPMFMVKYNREKVETIRKLIRQSQAKLKRMKLFSTSSIFIILFLSLESDDRKLSPSWPHLSMRYDSPWPKHPLHLGSSWNQSCPSNRGSFLQDSYPQVPWVAGGFLSTHPTHTIQVWKWLPLSLRAAPHTGRACPGQHTEGGQPQPCRQPHLHSVKPNFPDKRTSSHHQASFC